MAAFRLAPEGMGGGGAMDIDLHGFSIASWISKEIMEIRRVNAVN